MEDGLEKGGRIDEAKEIFYARLPSVSCPESVFVKVSRDSHIHHLAILYVKSIQKKRTIRALRETLK